MFQTMCCKSLYFYVVPILYLLLQIIVTDCEKLLDKYIAEGRTFDYVFGDLTDIPLSSTPQGQVWDFIRLILNKALRVLKPSGKFMTHVSYNLFFFSASINSINIPGYDLNVLLCI
jgi:23S rRNA G2069 N7-methylase RlmK/C1962 C5-methylase RlmI